MKSYKWFVTALVIGLSVVACAQKNAGEITDDGIQEAAAETVDAPKPQPVNAKDYLPSKKQVDSVSYLLGINFGSFIKGYGFGDDLNFKEIQKGIKDFIAAEGDYNDPAFGEQFKINPEAMNDLFNEFLSKRNEYEAAINAEKSAKFFAENRTKEGVMESGSGLQYKIIEAGNDVKANVVDTVFVHYKGTLIDGTVFDEVPEDSEAIALPLNGVIAGWTEGLQLVGEGGKIELYVPAELGYGERPVGSIPANSTLIFEVSVEKVAPYIPAEE